MYFKRILTAGLCASLLALGGCDAKTGDTGPPGAPGTPAVDTVSISGTVTNSMSSAVVVGAAVSAAGVNATTDANGDYNLADVPVGAFDLTVQMTNFNSYSTTLAVVAGNDLTKNVSLAPVAAVVVTAADASASTFGEAVPLSATVTCYDGRTDCTATWGWTQTHGVAATPTGGENAATETYTIGTEQEYKDNLFADVLDDDLFIRRGASVSDRIIVHGINPHSLEQGIEAEFSVTATMANGDSASADVMVTSPALPYDIAPGLSNVPRDRVVVLHGPTSFDTNIGGAGYTWSMPLPAAGSALTSGDISDASTQHAFFTPDVMGVYGLEVTDGSTVVTIDVTAGDWAGAISGIGTDGKPESSMCTNCHNDVVAPDKFASWRNSGHAHILTDNLNTSTHYSSACFSCHTVGFDPNATNDGIDEASDYDAWLASGMFNVPNAENWANTMANFPNSALKANIQCENCHGPQLGGAHMQSASGDTSRISLSSDVCATCHGEPLRHARFQQWQESGHNNQHGVRYGDAETNRPPSLNDPGAGHCGRCHGSQGFRRWIKQDVTAQGQGNYIDLSEYVMGAGGEVFVDGAGDANSGYQTALMSLGMTNQEATSQSCATCHKVHDPGSLSGEPNDVKMRITANDTLNLPGGFEASGLGHGNLCIACHNSRNGEHNDFVYDWDANAPTLAPSSFMDSGTPHASAQGDMLMGENAFFVNVGDRSKHSFIANACANCHMELEPPPADLSYNLSGTNHTFHASTGVCQNCHGAYDGGSLESVTDARIAAMEALFETELLAQIQAYIADAVAAGGSIRAVDDDASCTETVMTVPGDLTSASLGRSLALVYASNPVSVPMGETDTTCGFVGLVEYDGGGTALGLLIERPLASGEYAGQALMKANWNIALVADDGSNGIHNPGFAQSVLNATESVLRSLP